jgi:ABC-type branched-subunit amino acid transport system ATPase component
MLQAKSIIKNFGGVAALDCVDVACKKGLINAIIGPNGAGKTTLLNIISGHYTADGGEVLFEEKRITNRSPYFISSFGMARTFQNLQIFSHMTVMENLLVGRHIRGKSGLFSSALRLPWVRREEGIFREKCRELLSLFNLSPFESNLAGSLPFGRQRQLEIARALSLEPKLLLLDEPAAGLNSTDTMKLAEKILAIKKQGITIIIVEHDMDLIMDVSDIIFVLNFGKNIAAGTPREIQNNPEVIKAYLGE